MTTTLSATRPEQISSYVELGLREKFGGHGPKLKSISLKNMLGKDLKKSRYILCVFEGPYNFSSRQHCNIPEHIWAADLYGNALNEYMDAVVEAVASEYKPFYEAHRPKPSPSIEVCPHCGQEIPELSFS